MKAPVEEGEEYDVTIESIGAKGDGICKVDEFIIFVPDTEPDQKVKICIKKVMSRFAFAEKVVD